MVFIRFGLKTDRGVAGYLENSGWVEEIANRSFNNCRDVGLNKGLPLRIAGNRCGRISGNPMMMAKVADKMTGCGIRVRGVLFFTGKR